MATFIPAPGVAQARVTGTIGPNPWAVVLHWYAGSGSPWTQAQVNALAQAVANQWATHVNPLLGNNVVSKTVEAVDLTDSVERSAVNDIGPVTGGTPNPTPTLASSILVRHKIGSRYRGGHPRTYLPGSGTANTSDGDTWGAGFIATVNTDWKAFKDAVITSLQAAGLTGPNLCCPRYTYTYTADNTKHKFIKTRTTFLGPFPITADSAASNQIATQRRRLGM